MSNLIQFMNLQVTSISSKGSTFKKDETIRAIERKYFVLTGEFECR